MPTPISLSSPPYFSDFVKFAKSKGVSGRTALETRDGNNGTFTIMAKSKWDFIGNIGRDATSRAMNDKVRASFKRAVLDLFSVADESGLPELVRTAMKFEDYDKGKPLTARRILAVQAAIDQNAVSMAQTLKEKAFAELGLDGSETDPSTAQFKAEIEERIGQVAEECRTSPDAFELILKNPLDFLCEESDFRGVEVLDEYDAIEKTTDVIDNVEILQEATADTPDLFVAAKPFMVWADEDYSFTAPLAEGMVKTVMTLDADAINDLKLLAPGASMRDVQKAVASFDQLFSHAMHELDPIIDSEAARVSSTMRDKDSVVRYKHILTSMIFARAFGGGDSLRNARAALEGDEARKLMKYSQDQAEKFSKDVEKELKENRRLLWYMAKGCEGQAKSLERLKGFLDTSCDGPDAEGQPIIPFEGEVQTVDSEVSSHVGEGFSEEMADEQEACINDIVKGEGESSEALRDVIDRKLNDVHEFDSAAAVKSRCETSVKRMLCRDLGQRCAAFTKEGGMDAFTDMLSSVSLKIADRSHFMGGVGWLGTGSFKASPDTAATMCDQLAAFITGNPHKKFANLDATHQTKVLVIMSFVSQLKQAAFMGPGFALNTAADREKDGLHAAFSCIGDSKADVCSAEVTMKNKRLQITFTGRRNVRQLQARKLDGSLVTTDVGAGSTQDVAFTFMIDEAEINRMARERNFHVGHGKSICADFQMTVTVNDAIQA